MEEKFLEQCVGWGRGALQGLDLSVGLLLVGLLLLLILATCLLSDDGIIISHSEKGVIVCLCV